LSQDKRIEQKRGELFHISKSLEKIILIEFFPRSLIASLNAYCKKNYNKDMIYIDEGFSKSPPEFSVGMIDISNSTIPEDIEKIILYSYYHFGDYIELAFYCQFKKDFNDYLGELPFSDRSNIIIQKQRDIEEWIPKEFYGFFLGKEIVFMQPDLRLLSIYVYNVNKFQSEVFEVRNGFTYIATPTPRSNAENFVKEFQTDIDSFYESSLLSKIGILYMLGLIREDIIVFLGINRLKYRNGSIFSNYIILNFLKNELLPNDSLSKFVNVLLPILHFVSVLDKINYEINLIQIPKMNENQDIAKLRILKKEGLTIEAKINSLNSILINYCNTPMVKLLKKGKLVFDNEETWVNGFLGKVGEHHESISEYFAGAIDSPIESLKSLIQDKKQENQTFLERVIDEVKLISERPEINSMLSDLGDHLIHQINKWKNKIHQNEIEAWLLNFETREDRVLGLKLLNEITYVSYQDFKILTKALYNKIKFEIDLMDKPSFLFSHIGDITGGSAHVLKLFQEENNISEELFVHNSKLSNCSGDILFLIDDFIGHGSYFINWRNKNMEHLNGFKRIFYCSLTGFDEGIKKIIEQTKISVLCGNIFDTHKIVIDGEIFSNEQKEEIKKLMEKYSKLLPHDYIWGKDDCQLLIMFEVNIPNNSLAILWASKYWTPLKQRK
jgi:hypothetical protein